MVMGVVGLWRCWNVGLLGCGVVGGPHSEGPGHGRWTRRRVGRLLARAVRATAALGCHAVSASWF